MPEDKPWLLWVSFVGPHEPFDTPDPWTGSSRGLDLPKARKNLNGLKIYLRIMSSISFRKYGKGN